MERVCVAVRTDAAAIFARVTSDATLGQFGRWQLVTCLAPQKSSVNF